jgi:WD40 repeat protein
VAFLLNGELLASGSYNNTIKLWDPTTGKLWQTLEGHSCWVESVAFLPNGKLLVSSSYDKTVKLWDPTTGELWQTLEGHSD